MVFALLKVTSQEPCLESQFFDLSSCPLYRRFRFSTGKEITSGINVPSFSITRMGGYRSGPKFGPVPLVFGPVPPFPFCPWELMEFPSSPLLEWEGLGLSLNGLIMCCMVRINRLQCMYHGSFNVLHLLSDTMGLLDKLMHDISLIFQNHLQLRWLLKLLDYLLEDIPLLEVHIPSLMVFPIFCNHIGWQISECKLPILHCIHSLLLVALSWAHNLFSKLLVTIF